MGCHAVLIQHPVRIIRRFRSRVDRWRICDCTGIGVVYGDTDQGCRGDFVAGDFASVFFGVASHVADGREISLQATSLFFLGGAVGVSLGGLVGKWLPDLLLQRTFATGIVTEAFFIVSKPPV